MSALWERVTFGHHNHKRPVVSFRVRRRLFATSGTSSLGLGSQTGGLHSGLLQPTGLQTPASCQSVAGTAMDLDDEEVIPDTECDSHSDISTSTATTLTLYSE